MKLMSLVLTIAISAILISGCSKKEPTPQPTTNETEKPVTAEPAPEPAPVVKEQIAQKAAPLEGLTYVKGDPVTFTEGEIYVVEFWATWCRPCWVSIPHLTKIQKQFKDKGVTVIGISNETVNTVRPFVEKMGDNMNYTVAVDTKGKANAGYMQAYNQQGIPTAFIVDGKGNIAWVGHPMDGLDAVLDLIVVKGTFDAEAYEKAKADAEATEKKLYELFQEYFTAVQNGNPLEQTRPIAEKFIEAGHPDALNAMAWDILTLADKSQRDIEMAMKAAEKANAQTNGENPMVLDTYALALFENGKIAEAITAQEKAIIMTSGNEKMQADMKIRLDEFKAALKEAPSNTK